ncbi:hypothetical protein SAMN05444166_4288 [Singulisphaera sp. GP187]|uniref:hypothetical protein n=1 Tax=Singulisphaera sp. GP187 TaxID=1882752 RepID=UPI00092BC3ED|nr:hypothetical protein [Singulisphaera sp. GP187]SIO38701.1 hypothetical protein SAMN05444166_4288 [Singulisphaera sp. GP187]
MSCVYAFRVMVGLAVALSAVGGASETRAQATGKDEGGAGRTESLASLARTVGTGPQAPITILMAPAVQRELKLTDAQKTKVFSLSVSAMQKQRDHFQTLFLGGGGEGAMNHPQGMLAARDGMRRENDQAISQILEEKQKERFNQIVLRTEGPLAVARPDIAAKLGLKDTQRQYVQSIMTQMQQNQFLLFARMRQGAALGQVGPGQIAQLRDMMEKVRDGAVQQLSKVIDAKQKNAFNKMLGEPFDLAKLDPGASPEPEAVPGTSADAASKPAQDPATSASEASDKDAPTDEPAAKSSSRSARKKARPKAKTSQ